jgi:hypothetical protein
MTTFSAAADCSKLHRGQRDNVQPHAACHTTYNCTLFGTLHCPGYRALPLVENTDAKPLSLAAGGLHSMMLDGPASPRLAVLC